MLLQWANDNVPLCRCRLTGYWCSDITITATTTTTWWLLLWLLVLLSLWTLRLSSLEWLPSLFPTLVLLLWLSERAMEEKRKGRRTAVSWFFCSVFMLGKSGHIVGRPVRQIELICNLICCYCCCCCCCCGLVPRAEASVFVHDHADNRRRLEVNWFEFIWRHLKTIPRPLELHSPTLCSSAFVRKSEHVTLSTLSHPYRWCSFCTAVVVKLCKHQWLCQSGAHNHYTPFLLLWSSSSLIVKLRDQHQHWLLLLLCEPGVLPPSLLPPLVRLQSTGVNLCTVSTCCCSPSHYWLSFIDSPLQCQTNMYFFLLHPPFYVPI